MISIWTDEHVVQTAALWADGVSAGAIAAQLSAEWRVTVSRNAVIGKAHRCGWGARAVVTCRPHPRNTKPRSPQYKPPLPNGTRAYHRVSGPVALPPYHPPEPVLPSTARMVTLEDLTFNSCRYPHGDPRSPDFRFCGARRMASSSDHYEPYCAEHHKLCTIPRRQENANGPSNFKRKVSSFAIRN